MYPRLTVKFKSLNGSPKIWIWHSFNHEYLVLCTTTYWWDLQSLLVLKLPWAYLVPLQTTNNYCSHSECHHNMTFSRGITSSKLSSNLLSSTISLPLFYLFLSFVPYVFTFLDTKRGNLHRIHFVFPLQHYHSWEDYNMDLMISLAEIICMF